MKSILTVWTILLGALVAAATSLPAPAQVMTGVSNFVVGTSGGGGACLPLDCSITGSAKAAYSTLKLRAAYAGSCFTIIRLSDSTTTNIGFSGNDCDSSAASTFCNATTCELTKWFDQSGNGRDCTPDAGHRPELLFSAINGKMAFSATNTAAVNADCVILSTTPTQTSLSLNLVGAPSCNFNSGAYVEMAAGSGRAGLENSASCGAGSQMNAIYYDGTTANFSALVNFTSGTYYALGMTGTTTRSALWLNGVEGTDGTTTVPAVNLTDIYVSVLNGNGPTPSFNSAEDIIWSASISDTDLKTICRAQTTTARYNISTSC